jgi:glycosyltransferase involved in cell wall biosynthesis
MQHSDHLKNNQQNPEISIILPVYNGEKTIRRAVDSIINQTYGTFELLIVNDGSIDNTSKILNSFKDSRVVILEQKNMGLVPSLNRGIMNAKGKYIARMDADDMSLPERLEKQFSFMEKNKSYAIVGTASKVIYSNGKESVRYRPSNTDSIRKNIVKICPFTHSSILIRKSVLNKIGLYDESMDGSKKLLVEDYDLWVRILKAGYNMANLKDVLIYNYRENDSIIRRRTFSHRLRQQILSRIEIIKTLNLGFIAYLNLIPVAVLSVLTSCGFKVDAFFNLLSNNKKSDITNI